MVFLIKGNNLNSKLRKLYRPGKTGRRQAFGLVFFCAQKQALNNLALVFFSRFILVLATCKAI